MRRPGIKKERGTQVGARRRIPSEDSRAFWTSCAEGAGSLDLAAKEADIEEDSDDFGGTEIWEETFDLLLRIEL